MASNLPQRIQSSLMALATGALGWIALNVHETNVKVAVIIEKVGKLEERTYAAQYVSPMNLPAPVPINTPDRPLAVLPASFPEPRRK